MQLLTGKNDEKAVPVAQYAHDLYLDMKNLRDDTIKNLGLSNEEAELALETLDNFLEELLEEKEQNDVNNANNNIHQIREEKNSILGALVKSVTEATINQSIANALQLDEEKLAGSEPYVINGIDMTTTGTSINQRGRGELIDNIEKTFKEIGVPETSLDKLVSELEKAQGSRAFMGVIQDKVLSGKFYQEIYSRLLPERELSNSKENKLENTPTMRPA